MAAVAPAKCDALAFAKEPLDRNEYAGSTSTPPTSTPPLPAPARQARERGARTGGACGKLLQHLGPGLLACLADTDGPCLLTAAQSGAKWGYSLLTLQLALIPVLYMAQELTARLGILRGMGMTAMLRHEVGPITAWLVSAPLLAACVLGLISEYSCVGQTMVLWNVPVWATNLVLSVGLIGVALTGSYSVAEKVGLTMGICQILFFATMFMAAPVGKEVVQDLGSFPIGKSSFVELITANIGAVIMPWMLAYQQTAVCQKGAEDEDLREHLFFSRVDTGVGSFITQGVMSAVLVMVAAVLPKGSDVGSVDDLLQVMTQVIGHETPAKIILTLAIVGACTCAAIVQVLCGAWTFEQAMGRASAALDEEEEAEAHGYRAIVRNMRQRPFFYSAFILSCAGAFVFTLLTSNAVDLSVFTEFANGVLMPPTIFTLWWLCSYRLPEQHRLGPLLKWASFVIFLVCSGFCLSSIFYSFKGDDDDSR